MAGRTSFHRDPNRTIVYWDSCVFIEWMATEPTYGQDAKDALSEMARRVRQGSFTIITSSLSISEVLSSRLPSHIAQSFPDLLRTEGFLSIDVDRKIASKASWYRDHYLNCQDEIAPKTLSTADAIHLATASINRCDAFYTFDGISGNTVGARPHKTRTLLPLGDTVAGDLLNISVPATSTIVTRVNSGLFAPENQNDPEQIPPPE